MATVNLSAQGFHLIADRDGSLTLYSWRIRTSQRRQRAIGRWWDQGTEYGICCSGENVHTVILTAGAPPPHTHLPLCCWDDGKVDLVKSSIGIYWENQTVESKCKILNRSWNHWGQRVSLFCKLQHSAKKKNHLSGCLERDIGKGWGRDWITVAAGYSAPGWRVLVASWVYAAASDIKMCFLNPCNLLCIIYTSMELLKK